MVIWPQIAGFLLVGYLCMTKAFAYLGIPQLQIFVGEIALAAFLLLKPQVVLGAWATSLLRASPLKPLGLALLAFVLYGVWQTARGAVGGQPLVHTLKYFIFNYYTLYLFLGIWVGLNAPEFLPKVIRYLAWIYGIYGIVWVVALRYAVDYHMPGTELRIFGQPGGGMVAILGLLCFERNLRAVWLPLALCITVTLALQVRAEWLGLVLGTVAWGVLTGRIGRVLAMGVTGLAVLAMIEFGGIELSGRNKGSELSFDEIMARALAPIDLELAKEFSPEAGRHASTAEWRERWWEQIWLSVHATPMLEAFGHGYGFDLFGLAPADVRAGQENWDVRTPHSVFYFALGYTGWVGVTLFGIFQFTIFRLVWQAYRLGGQPAGVVFWIMGMSMAFFEESFDTPYRAIPFYLLVGLTIAPALQWQGELHARVARAQLLSVARR